MAVRQIVCGLLVAFVITAPALAQRSPDDRIDRRLDMLDARLDLTDEQESQIRQIWTQHQEDVQAWMMENKNATRADRQEHFRSRANDVHAAIRSVLTPDQAIQFSEFQAGRGGRMSYGNKGRPSGPGMRGFQNGQPGMRGMQRGGRGVQNGGRGMRGMQYGSDIFTRIDAELDLSDAQQAELRDAIEDNRAEGRAWRQANPGATPEQVKAYHEAHFAQLKARLGDVLTPEQIQEFEELHEAQREQRLNRMGNR